MKLEENKVAKIAFKLYVNGFEGELVEEIPEDEGFEFLVGSKNLLLSLEDNLMGMEKGEDFKFEIPKDHAYGDYNENMKVDLEKSIFVDEKGKLLEEELQIGNYIPMRDNENNLLNGKVLEVGDDKVKLDFNHPLSGESLFFEGKILDIREATEEEIDHGHVHNGQHHH
jgi:FKBP-type peptidyl-prolyl cis-trans isomerase SlyD